LVSGLAALDIDAGRADGRRWWAENRSRLPGTRTHRTRSGGLHLLFRHVDGLRCSAGKLAIGIDVRAEGGFIVWWPAAGLPTLHDAPLAAWPEWLLALLAPASTPVIHPIAQAFHAAPSDWPRYAAVAALRRAVERVAVAPEGQRNDTLNRETFALARFLAEGALAPAEIADALAIAARHAGLSARETAATLVSALLAGSAA
jgi:hypothetical protein